MDTEYDQNLSDFRALARLSRDLGSKGDVKCEVTFPSLDSVRYVTCKPCSLHLFRPVRLRRGATTFMSARTRSDVLHALSGAAHSSIATHAFPESFQPRYPVDLGPLRPRVCSAPRFTNLYLPREAPHQHADSARSILLPSSYLGRLALQPHPETITEVLALHSPFALYQCPGHPMSPYDLAGTSIVSAALLG